MTVELPLEAIILWVIIAVLVMLPTRYDPAILLKEWMMKRWRDH